MSVSEFNESQLFQEMSPDKSGSEDSKPKLINLASNSTVQDQLLKSESNQSCMTASPGCMMNLMTVDANIEKNEYAMNNFDDMDLSCLDDLNFEDFDLTGDFLLQ